jgi:hypothetical protein
MIRLRELIEQYVYHVTRKKNIPSLKKHGIQPRTPEDMEGEREAIYLFPTIEDRDTALGQWFGMRYDDEEELVSLKIDVRGLTLVPDAPYEVLCFETIPWNRVVDIEEV